MEQRQTTGSDIRFNDPPDRGPDTPVNRPISTLPRQDQWRWCRDCNGLWFAGGASSGGRCAAGGSHTAAGSGNYAISYGYATSGGQNGWRFCSRCHGLWFDRGTSGGYCPGLPLLGNRHTAIGSWFYVLAFDAKAVGQRGWRWCNNCEGLWYAGAGHSRHCPRDHRGSPATEHNQHGSADYAVRMA
jgi:hypothetical protein